MNGDDIALRIDHANLKGTVAADLDALTRRVETALAALAVDRSDIAVEKLTFALADIAACKRTITA